MEGVPEPIGVVATVAEQLLLFWQVVQQGRRAGLVATSPAVMKGFSGRLFASVTAGWLVFIPPLVRPIRRPRFSFLPACSMSHDAASDRSHRS